MRSAWRSSSDTALTSTLLTPRSLLAPSLPGTSALLAVCTLRVSQDQSAGASPTSLHHLHTSTTTLRSRGV